MTDLDTARAKIADTLADSLGELVTGWVLVATTITDDGQSAAWSLTQPDQPTWTTLGLLAWAQIGEGDDE